MDGVEMIEWRKDMSKLGERMARLEARIEMASGLWVALTAIGTVGLFVAAFARH